MNKKHLIITSIADDQHPILNQFAVEAQRHDFEFIVIGDTKSPDSFNITGCDFWSIDRQLNDSNFLFSKKVPTKHYARKNIGYLLAIKGGAEIIVETDDDNIPIDGFWDKRNFLRNGRTLTGNGWVNAYKYFSDVNIWPRGLPLSEILKNQSFKEDVTKEKFSPIIQGLANENPDIDAIYRLVLPLPINFEDREDLILSRNQWCPFNSQNTTWHKEAFPLLYLPSYCSFRMTDIWRSFVAQRIAWEYDWNITFHKSTVIQERNDHNLMKDFEDEIPGYLNNAEICSELQKLDLSKDKNDIGKNLIKCYTLLVSRGWVGKEELELLDLWLNDLGI